MSNGKFLALALFCAMAVSLATAGSVNFDNVTAPCLFSQVPNYSPFIGPGVTFNNGVVLNGCGWNNEETSSPNLYGTSDFLPLGNGTLLPGNVDVKFAAPVSNISFELINGFAADPSFFTATALDSSGHVLGTVSTFLFGEYDDYSSYEIFNLAGISEVTITSTQSPGHIDFATDSWAWVGGTTVPEPSSLLLLGGGIFGLWSWRKRIL